MDDLRNLAQSLHQEGRSGDALLLLNHLDNIEPGHVETLKQRVKVLGALGQTLAVLETLAALKSSTVNVEYLLDEIRGQIPATLKHFHTHIAAGELELAEKYIAALAGLIPGNAAVLDSALSCNLALGRRQNAEIYASALHALGPQPVRALPRKVRAPLKKTKRARQRA